VFAASSLREDRLGESLVEAGRITGQQYDMATATMQARSQRFGEALIHAGVMDNKELGKSVARQVRKIVLSLFPLDDGAASFEDRNCSIPLEYMVNVSLHHLLYQGIPRMTAEKLIRRGIGELERVVSLADVPPFRFSLDHCSPEEREILSRCRGRVTLLRLLDGKDGIPLPRLQAGYALLASGVLRDPTATAGPQPVMQADEGFILSSLQRGPEESEVETLRAEIASELARSAGDREQWLAVSQAAPAADVIPALRKKIDRYHRPARPGAGRSQFAPRRGADPGPGPRPAAATASRRAGDLHRGAGCRRRAPAADGQADATGPASSGSAGSQAEAGARHPGRTGSSAASGEAEAGRTALGAGHRGAATSRAGSRARDCPATADRAHRGRDRGSQPAGDRSPCSDRDAGDRHGAGT
jgi:hypothetical protein